MRSKIRLFKAMESGSTTAEYGLLISLLVLSGAASMHATGSPFATMANFISNTFLALAVFLEGPNPAGF